MTRKTQQALQTKMLSTAEQHRDDIFSAIRRVRRPYRRQGASFIQLLDVIEPLPCRRINLFFLTFCDICLERAGKTRTAGEAGWFENLLAVLPGLVNGSVLHYGQLARRSRFEPTVKKEDRLARNLVEVGGDSGLNCLRTGRGYEFHLLHYRHLHGARCGATDRRFHRAHSPLAARLSLPLAKESILVAALMAGPMAAH